MRFLAGTVQIVEPFTLFLCQVALVRFEFSEHTSFVGMHQDQVGESAVTDLVGSPFAAAVLCRQGVKHEPSVAFGEGNDFGLPH